MAQTNRGLACIRTRPSGPVHSDIAESQRTNIDSVSGVGPCGSIVLEGRNKASKAANTPSTTSATAGSSTKNVSSSEDKATPNNPSNQASTHSKLAEPTREALDSHLIATPKAASVPLASDCSDAQRCASAVATSNSITRESQDYTKRSAAMAQSSGIAYAQVCGSIADLEIQTPQDLSALRSTTQKDKAIKYGHATLPDVSHKRKAAMTSMMTPMPKRAKRDSSPLKSRKTIIVGGGMIGLALARELAISAKAKRSRNEITVIEIGSTVFALASGNNAGIISTEDLPTQLHNMGELSCDAWLEMLNSKSTCAAVGYEEREVVIATSREPKEAHNIPGTLPSDGWFKVVQGRRASKGWSVGGFGSHDCAVQLVGLAKYNELDDLTVEGAMLLAASSMACGVSSQGVSEGSQLVFIE
ncbi:hypothetical protein M8818_007065 [Zalaria obscura]|uniref:Uncharacterized protein n=1 Tax=Zalaria obscura TaxID=2024903 RepID=A0ACC3S5T5_9PEZI